MRHYSEADLLKGICSHNTRILNYIYCEFLPYIDHFVRQNGGSSEEAKDVFQEGMIIVYKKISGSELSLNCKFSTYLYAVCRNIWMQHIKKRKRRNERIKERTDLVEEPVAGSDPLIRGELKALFERQFARLSFDCQRILKMFYNGCSFQEIRAALGYKTIQHTIDRKYRCNKSLIQKITDDPTFNELKDEISA